jgi:branched-chain amino acid aminotransferase/4-amino-4-deoxychorismate lyase
MLNTAGEIAGADAANLFWFEGDALLTPALDCGVLDGITRAAVIARARAAGLEVRDVHAPRVTLDNAAGLFLTNSLIGLRPVSHLDAAAIRTHPGLAVLSG